MATALTVYPTATAATTVTTADTLATSAPSSETSHTSKTGKSTGWGELYSQGNTTAWAAGSSEPAADGHGWLLDATTLEGQEILSGTWTPKIKLSTSSGTVTCVVHMRAYKRSSGGVYSLIVDCASGSVGLTSTAAVISPTAASGALTTFATGDKLYVDVVLHITANSSTSNTATTSVFQNGGANEEFVTPGYQAQPVTDALAGTLAGVGTTSAALSLLKPLGASVAGQAVVSLALSVLKPLGASVAGRAIVSLALSVLKPLQGNLSGLGALSGALSVAGGGLQALAGLLAGVGNTVGGLSLVKYLQSLVGGSGQAIAQLNLTKPLLSTLSATSTVHATLTVTPAQPSHPPSPREMWTENLRFNAGYFSATVSYDDWGLQSGRYVISPAHVAAGGVPQHDTVAYRDGVSQEGWQGRYYGNLSPAGVAAGAAGEIRGGSAT